VDAGTGSPPRIRRTVTGLPFIVRPEAIRRVPLPARPRRHTDHQRPVVAPGKTRSGPLDVAAELEKEGSLDACSTSCGLSIGRKARACTKACRARAGRLCDGDQRLAVDARYRALRSSVIRSMLVRNAIGLWAYALRPSSLRGSAGGVATAIPELGMAGIEDVLQRQRQLEIAGRPSTRGARPPRCRRNDRIRQFTDVAHDDVARASR